MSNPQLENGYLRIATEIIEALARYRIPGEQMQCLLCIIRKTYGFNKKVDIISNSQFVDATGLNKSNICRAIKSLVDKNIVVKKDNNYIPSYEFNKKYRTWKVLSKKTTVVKSDILVLSKKRPTINNTTKDNICKRLKFEKKVPVPDDFCLTDQMIKYAKSKRYNASLEKFTEGMVLSAKAHGYKYKDWFAAWQTWLRKDIGRHPDRQDPIEDYT